MASNDASVEASVASRAMESPVVAVEEPAGSKANVATAERETSDALNTRDASETETLPFAERLRAAFIRCHEEIVRTRDLSLPKIGAMVALQDDYLRKERGEELLHDFLPDSPEFNQALEKAYELVLEPLVDYNGASTRLARCGRILSHLIKPIDEASVEQPVDPGPSCR